MPATETVQGQGEKIVPVDHTISSVARYTMHDMKTGGCLDPEQTGICSHFATKDAVFFSAGPEIDGLADGVWTFSVLVPGYQVGGFRDGVDGNLSDRVAGGTSGDDGTGDAIMNRTFTVKNHAIIDYNGQHRTGVSEGGQKLIALGNFDDAPNAGGLYVLALCKDSAVDMPVCRFDAFVVGDEIRMERAMVGGMVYYDANTDGHLNPGEAALADFKVFYSNGVKENKKDAVYGEEQAALDGTFDVVLDPDEYTIWQELPKGHWMQTGNQANQAVLFGPTQAGLNEDMTYGLTVDAASITGAVLFGDVCLGGGGGHTAGWWGGMAPLSLLGPDDLAALRELNLRTVNGMAFDPTSVREFRDWLGNASASNMASRLSAQLATMALNVEHDFVDRDALAYAPDTDKANDNGFAHVQAMMAEADLSLATHGMTIEGSPERIHQEHLMNALNQANADVSFAQPTPVACTPDVKNPL